MKSPTGLILAVLWVLLMITQGAHQTQAQVLVADRFVTTVSMGEGTGRRALVLLQPSTGAITYLTNGDYLDGGGELSPDGERVVFVSDRAERGTGFDLFILELATGLITPLVITPSQESNPRWSPDGTQIAYEARDRDGNAFSNIYIINADDTNNRPLTTTGGREHVWAPDGQSLAYADRDMYFQHVSLDGTLLRQLTSGEFISLYGQWSPDGNRFAFAHNENIWYVNFSDPSRVQRVSKWLINGFQWVNNDVFIFTAASLDVQPFYSFLDPQGTIWSTYRVDIDGINVEEVPALRPYMSLIDDVSGFGVNRFVEMDDLPPATLTVAPKAQSGL